MDALVERARSEPTAVGDLVRALEARTESRAQRLGLRPERRRALPATPEGMAYRVRALRDVATFLGRRRETVRARDHGRIAPRGRGASTRGDVVRLSRHLGLDRPDSRVAPHGDEARRWHDIARWLARRHEAPRDVERPLTRPAEGPLSSPFGFRGGRAHEGIDIGGGATSGAPVRAAADGVVAAAGWSGGYGLTVVVRHPDGLRTIYAHLSSTSVTRGRPVERGRMLGRMGATGNARGVHLHFEVRRRGVAVDPLPHLGDRADRPASPTGRRRDPGRA